MILLKQKNILFIKGFKVAGTSFEIALSKFAVEGDIIGPLPKEDETIRQQLKFRGPQNYTFKNIELFNYDKSKFIKSIKHKKEKIKFSEHLPAEKAKIFLGSDYFNKLTKIAIVRNPFDYLISRYNWEKSAAEYHNLIDKDFSSFENWVMNNPKLINENQKIYNSEKEDFIDEYIRFENFKEDIDKIENNYQLDGLYEIFKNIKTKSNIRNDKELKNYFTNNDLINTVKFLNSDLIKNFEYSLNNY